MTEPDNFLLDLQAKLSGFDSIQDYTAKNDTIIKSLDKIEAVIDRAKVKNLADFNKYSQVKYLLSGLSCYTFNTKHPQNDRVWELESKLGGKCARWVKSQTVKDSFTLTELAYFTWDCHYPDDRFMVLRFTKDLLSKGLLWKSAKSGNLMVTGMHKRVGDNVFTVDYRGREHRTYVGSMALQAFYVSSRISDMVKDDFIKRGEVGEIPELPDYYDGVWCGDGKGSARHSRMTYKMRSTLQEVLHGRYEGGL